VTNSIQVSYLLPKGRREIKRHYGEEEVETMEEAPTILKEPKSNVNEDRRRSDQE